MEQAVSNQINTTKLLAVEKLLWGHTPKRPGEGMQGMCQIAGLILQHLVFVQHQHTADSWLAVSQLYHSNVLVHRVWQPNASQSSTQIAGYCSSIH